MVVAFDSGSSSSSSTGNNKSPHAQQLERQLGALAQEEFGYLATRGRVSGRTHEVEIWFAVDGSRIYMLSGGGEKADWVKNIRQNPGATMRIAGTTFAGDARFVAPGDEDTHTRGLLAAKYQQWTPDLPLSDWARTSLPVVIDVQREQETAADTKSS